MTPKRDRIFISYRRTDAAGATTALRKTLAKFERQLFHDVTGISLGDPFPDTLRRELDRAAVVLAVIGKGWLAAANEHYQRRIDFPTDWVNIELSTALANPDVTVIPVLVDGADMPPAKVLPAELAELPTRNSVRLRHEAWDETCRPLARRIEQIFQSESSQQTASPRERLHNSGPIRLA